MTLSTSVVEIKRGWLFASPINLAVKTPINRQKALDTRFITELREPDEWNAVSARRLPAISLHALLAQTRRQSYDEDLAALVRSVARPGVWDRIQEYLGHRERMLATNAAIEDIERQHM
jgi:hypothetical protein